MSGKPKKFSEEVVTSVITLYTDGQSIWSIGQQFSIGHTSIKRILLDNGIQPETRQRSREQHGMWRGGRRVTTQGYVEVRADLADPIARAMCQSNGQIQEHRLVMAHYLDRPLHSWETVHHIDGDKQNNDITNLQLRIGPHGKGQVYRCMDCGSTRIEPVDFN